MLYKEKILLVEDSSDDIELTLRAFKKNNIMNDVIVMRDGGEALDYFSGRKELPKKIIRTCLYYLCLT
jgi:hypothetical protein